MDADLPSLRETLSDINELLELSDDGRPDLVALMSSLSEIIKLKEAELELEERKRAALEVVSLVLQESGGHGNVGEEEVEDKKEEDLAGTRCSLPGWTSRGYFVNQNAVISEVIFEKTNTGEKHVRIFVTNPSSASDVPCDAFLTEGPCTKGIRCNLSHGIVASVEVCQFPKLRILPNMHSRDGFSNEISIVLPQGSSVNGACLPFFLIARFMH